MRSMYTYIEQAPSIARDIIAHRDALVGPLVEQFCGMAPKRLLIVASGSSYDIAMSMRPFMQRTLGIEVSVEWPMSYILYNHAQNDETFVLCMSQSGRSTNTIEAVRRAQACGHHVAVLTCNPDAPMREHCEHVYAYGSGTEDYYVAKGFPTSCVYLALFAIEAARTMNVRGAEDCAALLSDVSAVVDDMEDVYPAARSFADKHLDAFVNARRIMCVGIGAGYGVALEGALKLNEMIGVAANAYEMEEFVHGPTYEIRRGHVVVLVDLGGPGRERMMQLYRALHVLTDDVYVIDAAGEGVAGSDEKTFAIKPLADVELDAPRAVIPFQVLAESICSKLDLLSYNLSNLEFEKQIKNKAN